VARAAGDAEREREQHKAQALAAGMAPEAVADMVWEALGDRRFWILPYPAHAQWALDRAREIVAAAGVPADEEEPVR